MTETSGITPADIESKFRSIQDQVDVVTDGPKKKAMAGGAIALILLLIIYVLGRKSGKKKSTVLEIRRM